MAAGSMSDPYLNYYAWPSYQTNPTGGVQDATWTSRDGVYSGYGQLPNADYMQAGPMFGQYDYSYWYPNMDPSTGSWGPSGHALYKSRDYQNGSYYGNSAGAGGSLLGDGAYNGDSSLNGAVQSAEQGFKGMSLSGAEEEKEVSSRSSGVPACKKSWANIVTQSSRSANRPKMIPRAPIVLSKQTGDSSWETGRGGSKLSQNRAMSGEGRQTFTGPYSTTGSLTKPLTSHYSGEPSGEGSTKQNTCNLDQSEYNPKDFDLNPKGARFFVIKSFSEDDIHRSIKYSIWCSTEYGNKRLDSAYKEREGKGQVFLYFSVNGSGHFCGVALMTSAVDYNSSSEVWAQNKWKGQFSVKWIYVKDVPNSQLRHIRLENNENKPVTNSRDTQEVPYEKGKQVLRVIHQYRHTTSIFDDFNHYEKQQEETQQRKNSYLTSS